MTQEEETEIIRPLLQAAVREIESRGVNPGSVGCAMAGMGLAMVTASQGPSHSLKIAAMLVEVIMHDVALLEAAEPPSKEDKPTLQ